MPRQLNIKLVLFYSFSIVGVVTLFNFVTAYGQTNIKAPPKLSGTYQIKAKALSRCLKGDTLILKIEQSGLYLNGLLISSSREIPEEISGEEALSLAGHFNDPEITLKGNIDALKRCPSADPQGQVVLKAIGKQQKLTGVLTSGSLSIPFQTVAKVEQTTNQTKEH